MSGVEVPKLAKWWASGLGSGYLPLAPGTWGSLFGISALILLRLSFGDDESLSHFSAYLREPLPLLELLACLLIIASGWWATAKVLPFWGKDPAKVVIDEWAGIWLSLLWIPMTWQTFALGFLVFRLLDIYKPLGIREAEKLPGAAGVMLDDLFAGLATNLALRMLLVLIPTALI